MMTRKATTTTYHHSYKYKYKHNSNVLVLLLTLVSLQCQNTNGFLPFLAKSVHTRNVVAQVSSSSGTNENTKPNELSEEEQQKQQWELFTKYHALGEWRGKWEFRDYLGDVMDSTFGSVNLYPDEKTKDKIMHEHAIQQESVSSDCKTCTDWTNSKVIPIGSYTPSTFFSTKNNLKNNRCLSNGMITGPTIIRGGIMSTELSICNPVNKEERMRVIFQHGPVWEQGVQPGSCAPQGLKLVRIMTAMEQLHSPSSEPTSTKPIPPYFWNNNEWCGTSHTWGPTTHNRLWLLEELEEMDAWHERPTGDNPNVWSLRLLGNHVLVQCPRVITGENIELFRIAWIFPNEEEQKETTSNENEIYKQTEQEEEWNLLRIEAGIWALESMDTDDNEVVSFFPPRLGSFRCDVLQNILKEETE